MAQAPQAPNPQAQPCTLRIVVVDEERERFEKIVEETRRVLDEMPSTGPEDIVEVVREIYQPDEYSYEKIVHEVNGYTYERLVYMLQP